MILENTPAWNFLNEITSLKSAAEKGQPQLKDLYNIKHYKQFTANIYKIPLQCGSSYDKLKNHFP